MWLFSIGDILRGYYCTFDYFTEYFMLSRNGSVIELSRFIYVYDKISYAYRTHVGFKNSIRIVRINRTIQT